MTYTIRRIEPRDDLRVGEIIRSCLTEYNAPKEGSALADPDLDCFSTVYASEGNAYWVAEDETGLVIGGTGIGRMEGAPGVCELRKMYCMPEARGTGVAHRLLETALAYANNYYSRCYLETFSNMVPAHKFYEKHGFRRTQQHFGETGHYLCDVLYIKDL